MSRLIRRLKACVLLAIAAAPLSAQRVRGTVVQGDGTTPAAGIVVVATSASGAVAGRVLSAGGGTFDIKLPASGTYSVSALRIGYRPTTVAGVVVADTGSAPVRLVLSGSAIALAAVAVRSNDVCGAAGDPQSQVVQVWSEARTALTAASLWSREPLDAEWIAYNRVLKPQGDAVRSQEVRSARSATTHAFKSWAAESLAARGYVITDGSGTTYHAPDPEVLLSPSFAETHCFHLEPPPDGSPGLVGVGFKAQRARGDRVEIEGTLWIDRASSELRWLDYLYVGLPSPADEANAGGRVEFIRIPDGAWLISNWYIRMPQVGAPERAEKGYQVNMLKESKAVLRGVGITGGMVSTLTRRGERLYTAQGASVRLQLVRSDPTVSVALPTVTLEGSNYSWRGDSAGMVRASPVLEGRYTARIATPEMTAFGVAPIEREIVVSAARARVDSVTMPSARDLLKSACGNDAVRGGLGAIYGTVRDSAGRAAVGRAVTASWVGTAATLPDGRVFSGRTTNGTLTDGEGAWRLCDVPRGKAIAVRASGDDGTAQADVTMGDDRSFVYLALKSSGVMPPASGDAEASTALLELMVRDRTGQAIDAASLELSSGGGEQRKLTTDPRGKALVASFPPGVVKLRAKRVGYAPGEIVFNVAAGRNTVPVILDKNALPVLDSVRVVGNRRGTSRLDGFETRRLRKEATASFGPEDIVKRNPGELSDLLRAVGSVRLVDSSGVLVAQLSRGFKLDKDANAQPCNMKVLLDGVIVPEGAGLNVVRPSEVRGLEVFASTSRTPTGLGVSALDAACGVIAIWTGKP